MESAAEITADVYSPETRAHPLRFYRQHCAGWTQEELFTRVPLLYYRLWRKRHLHHVPGQQHPEYGADAVAYYHRHYAGLTRGQLRDADPRFYEHLRRHGLLGPIPLKVRTSFPDPLAYYREHCAGMTRKQAAMAEPQFYGYLERRRLLDTLPFAAPAPAAGGTGRGTGRQEIRPERSPGRRSIALAGPHPRLPSVASAQLDCFRVIPDAGWAESCNLGMRNFRRQPAGSSAGIARRKPGIME